MTRKLKILFVASEVEPFVKTGGLADVAGSLPQEIKKLGHDIRVVLPEYSQIPQIYRDRLEPVTNFRTRVVWRNEYAGVNKLNNNGVETYFIDNKNFFYRDSLYENNDKHVQFIFFIRAILEMLPKIDFKPDIIHCNDWQSAPLPLLLNDNYKKYDFYQDIKTIYTIHNLQYQGQFSPEILDDVLGVSHEHWYSGNIRHNGLINYMKMGIMYSDYITTVSKTYAEEIKAPYYGEGLDYALQMNDDNLRGIINGISYQQFDPETDQKIYENFIPEKLEAKTSNKTALQKELGLPVKKDIPAIGFISRLVEQKGLDLLTRILDKLLQEDIQFIMLGTGQPGYENFFRELAGRYPDKVSANIKYDDKIARKMYAGLDIFLMPSRFEPCGLGQLISMRYGTIPVVNETGGLVDTVQNYNEKTDEGYGFTFNSFDAHQLLDTVNRAISYYQQPEIWDKLVKKAMNLDFSWHHSAQEYLELYQQISK